jgi:hypothetical protein
MLFLLVDFFCGCCRTRAGYSRGDQFYAAYPAGTELLTDATKVCDQQLLLSNFCCFTWAFILDSDVRIFKHAV